MAPNPYAHDVETELATALSRITNPFWFRDPTRPIAFLLFHNWLTLIILNFDTPMSPTDLAFPDDTYLQALLILLGHIIFGISLTDRVLIMWAPGSANEPLGVTVLVEGGCAGIKLNKSSNTTWRAIVTSLLHEMCHAYSFVYICKDGPRTKEYCGDLYHNGLSGHGWGLFDKEDLDIGRIGGAAQEANKMDEMPSREWLMQFFSEEQREQVQDLAFIVMLVPEVD